MPAVLAPCAAQLRDLVLCGGAPAGLGAALRALTALTGFGMECDEVPLDEQALVHLPVSLRALSLVEHGVGYDEVGDRHELAGRLNGLTHLSALELNTLVPYIRSEYGLMLPSPLRELCVLNLVLEPEFDVAYAYLGGSFVYACLAYGAPLHHAHVSPRVWEFQPPRGMPVLYVEGAQVRESWQALCGECCLPGAFPSYDGKYQV